MTCLKEDWLMAGYYLVRAFAIYRVEYFIVEDPACLLDIIARYLSRQTGESASDLEEGLEG